MKYATLAMVLAAAMAATSACSNKQEPAAAQPDYDAMRSLYPASADARHDIQNALTRATREHKRILIEFGADWCFDCHVLDYYFRQPQVAPLLDSNFVLVRVDVGEYNRNLDLAQQYSIPLQKGVPALAILEADGQLLFSSHPGEFSKTRSMQPGEIAEFLKKWKP
jgi:thiol:disulfide interchange protein